MHRPGTESPPHPQIALDSRLDRESESGGSAGIKRAGGGSAAAAAGMSGVTSLSIALAFITSPLQARALGPTGRGELAAVAVVITLAPPVLDLGLGAFVARETARGTDRGALLGTMLTLGALFSLIGVAAAVPLGHLIGHGREVVTYYVELALWLSPVYVLFQTLNLVAVAERRWGLVNRLRLAPPTMTAFAVVTLFAAGHLTVSAAIIVVMGSGLLSSLQLIPILWRTRGWCIRGRLIKPGVHYGLRSWVGTILAQGNGSLDQVLMTGLTSGRQLGLYAVATTVSSVSLPLVAGPLAAVRFADVAAGDHRAVASLCRVTLVGAFGLALAVAVGGPAAIVLLFGSKFAAAIPMLMILLVSSLPAAVGAVAITMLTAAGNPGMGVRAQAIGLVLTVPLLVAVLGRFGGLGAAVVDVFTNAVVAGAAIHSARRIFGGRLSDYWVPHRGDVHLLGTFGRQAGRRVRRALRLSAAAPGARGEG
jgi:O-antigen/teichoic acid export membrane protein